MDEATSRQLPSVQGDIKIKAHSLNTFRFRLPSKEHHPISDKDLSDIAELFGTIGFSDVFVSDHDNRTLVVVADWSHAFPASLVPHVPYKGDFLEIFEARSETPMTEQTVDYLSSFRQIILNDPQVFACLLISVVCCIIQVLLLYSGR
jgi:hypothetical protein